jgi:hypothetical protein
MDMKACSGFIWLSWVVSFEHSNESFGSIIGGEFLDQLNDCQIFKKTCVP